MNLEAYRSTLDYAVQNRQDALMLGSVANKIAAGQPPGEIPIEIIESGKKHQILLDAEDLTFASQGKLLLFYTINYVSENLPVDSSDESVSKFMQNLSRSSFPSSFSQTWHMAREMVYLVLNTFFEYNIPRLIAHKIITSAKVYRSYWDLLPYMIAELDDLINALYISTQEIKAQDNYLNLNQAVKKCAKENPDFAYQLLISCKSSKQKLELFFPPAFVGLSEAVGLSNTIYLLIELLRSTNKDEQITGLKTLAWLSGTNDHPEDFENEMAPILAEIESVADDQLTANLIYVYGLLIHKLSNARSKLMTIPAKFSGPDTYLALSNIISIKIETEDSETWFQNSLKLLSNLKGHHVGTYKNLSRLFAYNYNTRPELFFSYIHQFVENQDNPVKNIEAFKDAFEASLKNDRQGFEKWVTQYLNDENTRFHQAVAYSLTAIDHNLTRDLRLSVEVLKTLTAYDVEFILYKIVGNLISKEHLQSLTFSALQYHGDMKPVSDLVIQLFCFYIVYNYPASIKYLLEKKPTSSEIEMEVIAVIEQHYNEVHRIKTKKPLELAPSPDRLQKLFKQTTEPFRSYEDKSPFKEPSIIDYVTKVIVKAGNGFFRRHENFRGLKEKNKNRSTMGRVAVEFDLPGGEFIDPIGQEYNRYYWRNVKRRKK